MTHDGPSAWSVEGRIKLLGNAALRVRQGRTSPGGTRRAFMALAIIPAGVVVYWLLGVLNDLFN